jgi:hypothetical protein
LELSRSSNTVRSPAFEKVMACSTQPGFGTPVTGPSEIRTEPIEEGSTDADNDHPPKEGGGVGPDLDG